MVPPFDPAQPLARSTGQVPAAGQGGMWPARFSHRPATLAVRGGDTLMFSTRVPEIDANGSLGLTNGRQVPSEVESKLRQRPG